MTKLFRCTCGYPEYLELDYDKEDDYLSIIFIQQPKGIWDRLRGLFRHTYYFNEIFLEGDDVKRFKKFMSNLL